MKEIGDPGGLAEGYLLLQQCNGSKPAECALRKEAQGGQGGPLLAERAHGNV